jgi:hypothetical protein
MKKDIEIPVVKDVYVAAVLEENQGAEDDVWDIYFINNKNEPLEGVMITSRGYMETDAGTEMLSSLLRHNVGDVPSKSAVKVEIILPQVFEIYNEYWATFFCENKLMERKFVFGPFTIDKNFLEDLPVISAKGILVK